MPFLKSKKCIRCNKKQSLLSRLKTTDIAWKNLENFKWHVRPDFPLMNGGFICPECAEFESRLMEKVKEKDEEKQREILKSEEVKLLIEKGPEDKLKNQVYLWLLKHKGSKVKITFTDTDNSCKEEIFYIKEPEVYVYSLEPKRVSVGYNNILWIGLNRYKDTYYEIQFTENRIIFELGYLLDQYSECLTVAKSRNETNFWMKYECVIIE